MTTSTPTINADRLNRTLAELGRIGETPGRDDAPGLLPLTICRGGSTLWA